jgi:hypothetical protein
VPRRNGLQLLTLATPSELGGAEVALELRPALLF